MNLSPHFTLDELTYTDHREIDNTPGPAEIENLKRTAQLLENVRDVVASVVIVNSAYRCLQLNRAIGSKDTSQHVLGCAADIRVPGLTPDQVVQKIMAARLPFDQLIREFDRWTHISVPNDPSAKPRGQVLIIDKLGTRPY